MGGTRTVKQMARLCETKGGSLIGEGIVNWSHKERERKIDNVVEKFGRM
jgi:hypothetical protein